VTTVATDTSTTPESELEQDALFEAEPVPGTDVAPAPPLLIGEIVEAEVVEGEIVDGPVHLNTGEQPAQMPFRAGILDARGLRESTRFSREDVGDLSELVASIQERRGVKLPLIVLSVREPGSDHEDFEIVDGLRRKLAAVEAGHYAVPCWILEDEADIELILDMLEVNEHHKDLENVEVARAYQTMLDLGWSEQQIAAARRRHVDDVRAAIRARQLPAPAHRALNAGTLTFDMVQAVDEFADAPDDQQKLLDKLGDEWGFRQVLARLREKRSYQRERDLAKARLLLDGVDVTPRPRALDYQDGPVPVDSLVDADGKSVDIDEVKTLTGFHGFVEKNGAQARTVVYCDDPGAHGYTRRTPVSSAYHGMSEEQVAAQQEQERLTAERVDRLRLAAEVRRDFLASAYGSAKAARTLFVEALRSVTLGKALTRSAELDELFTVLGGSEPDMLAGAGEDRLRRTLVAKFICRQEYNLNTLLARVAGQYAYGLDETAALAWYDRLATQGYPLTDDEQAVAGELRVQIAAADAAASAAAAAQDDEDEDDEDGIVDAEIVDDGACAALHDAAQATHVAEPEAVDAQVVEMPFGANSRTDLDDLSEFEDAA
jgi:ParB/RepB/Spo0J family partition protein